MAVRTFEDLDVWKVCRELRTKLAGLAATFPKEEKFRLADQLIRSSRSVTANLAEGYGRFHYLENAQFARQARGSLYEALDHLTVCKDEKIVDDETFNHIRNDILRAITIVNGFIRYLKSAKVKSGSSD
ncbi:MAG: four helix bundle protein [Nitrospira sp. LK70]|nr:four helix bundle protein [Nitrospira sp. LK70]